MFSQLSSYIYSILVGCIFTTTSVFAVTCSSYQQTCYSYSSSDSWCCSYSETCGSYDGTRCIAYNPPSSDASPSVILTVVVVSICLCFTIIRCCIRAQQQERARASVINASTRRTLYSYQQQPIQRPTSVVSNRSVYSVSAIPPIHNVYEAPPPSYETVINNPPPKYTAEPSTPPPPFTAAVETTSLRV